LGGVTRRIYFFDGKKKIMSKEFNSVKNVKIGGQWYREYKIRELFCYRHPVHGHIVKKSYENQTIWTTGRVSPKPEKKKEIIEAHKRTIERKNVRATAQGCPPITEYWWEPPGPTGRFDDEGNPL
jgi:hypothetical protein